jgi:hypothetical protein
MKKLFYKFGCKTKNLVFFKPALKFLIPLLISILFVSSNIFGQIAPINPPTSGFHIDGNLRANTPTINIGDWLTGPGGSGSSSGGFVMSDAGVPVNAATTQLLPKDAYNTTADIIFSGGSKFDGNPNTNWSWTTSKPTGKDDINNAMYHLSTDASNNKWLILGSDRLATTGTSYIDFEFLQKTLTRNASGGKFTSAGPDSGRSVNDIVISMEYTGGGSTAKIHFYKWQHNVGDGFDWVEYKFVADGGIIPNAFAFGMTNVSSTTVPFLAFGLTSYIPYSFVEAAVNLTGLFGAIDPCLGLNIKTIVIKTKASDAVTAALKDFVDPIQVSLNFNAPTIDAQGPFCLDAAAVTLTGSPAGGTFSGDGVSGTTFTPATAGVGTHTITYTYTQNGCNKTATTDIVVNAKPSAPTITSGAATCSAAGTSTIKDYSSSNTYVFSSAALSVDASGLISGMVVGTEYTVTLNNGSCTSAASAKFSNAAKLATPAAPTITSGAATCTAAGSSTIDNYSSSNTYVFSSSLLSVDANGLISGMVVGTEYTVTLNNGSCTSAASAKFSNAAKLATPATPTIKSVAATCSATGSSTIDNYSSSNTYVFTPAGPSVGTGGLIGSMAVGTSYTVTSNNGSCTSLASAPFSNAANLASPTFKVCVVQPTLCSTGSLTINATGGTGFLYSINGSDPTASNTNNVFNNLGVGSVTTIKVKNGDGCSATPVNCAAIVSDCTPFPPPANRLANNTTTGKTADITEKQTTIKAYPNPFSDKVKFVVTASVSGTGNLEVYNTMGQKIKTVYAGLITAGTHTFELSLPVKNTSNLVYILRIGDKKMSGTLVQMNR